ncbi:CRISPR-associated protein Cas4 [Hyperthermus butylicus]|uniref:CRISPR-associated exonuclease Cas4 n=1 Tax=Hyperthermus butylicus (strain DSM 5456 / JCM 9403 / PLM1-5) TaxID=415426 RepID=A2BLD1_HYPBU|nr:CRISPR-associated protein Cas4 [Hyperthermus butylicus]ABM80792.1 conserved archaeal protein [Hyperthermus butylicus DSM 5456]
MAILEELYVIKQRDFSEKLRELTDPNVVYVTDLVTCSHKRIMRLNYPLLSFQFEPQLLIGELVHAGLQALLARDGSEWRAEVQIEERYDIDGGEVVLKGRADLVKYNDGVPETVVEIKTARMLPEGAPLEHHVMQLRIYLQLLGARRGILLYVTPDRLVEFEVEPVNVDIGALIRETVYDMRAPRYDWECRYCPFRKFCPYARKARQQQ